VVSEVISRSFHGAGKFSIDLGGFLSKPKRIFVSNRLPLSVMSSGEVRRGDGGLVSALLGVSLDDPFMWFGFETQQKNIETLEREAKNIFPQMQCRPVLLPKDIYAKYYDGFANDILWPLFHYEADLSSFQKEHWNAYLEANQKMAAAIAAEAQPGDSIWIHDFHFMMLPRFLRARLPDVKIGFFLHIPFPSPELFRELPVREEILGSLTDCDLVGFHEHSYLQQFIVSLKSILGIEASLFEARLGPRTLRLGVYPISIDSDDLKMKAQDEEVKKLCASYQKHSKAPFLLLGVDRLDYTKGLELKLRGFQHALKKYPELVGQVSLLQVAIPTREKVAAYIKLRKRIEQLVGSINGDFAKPNYTPVEYIYNSVSQTELLALYRRANAAMVTSKRDGMNLVAMEYVVAQELETAGTLILSEFAGSASLLSDALIINPWDVDQIADAIHRSYHMPLEERQAKMEHLQSILSRYSATRWAESFLKDLETLRESGRKQIAKPLRPLRQSWDAEFKNILSPQKMRLVLDYDGTLVGFTKHPDRALLPAEVKASLQRLQDFAEIFILSGRSRGFLEKQFEDPAVGLVAEHGAFYRLPRKDWKSRVVTETQSWYPSVEKAMSAYTERVPLSFIEKKQASLVFHFRDSPADFADYQAKKLDGELQTGFSNAPIIVSLGNKILEVKASECNKGAFLRWLMQESEQSRSMHYLCVGDDRTDEDMFAAGRKQDLTVKVGPGMTTAAYRLENQTVVLEFLKELILFFEN
jgi:trehalose 6-phosphate synthase/phosphatase